jgi:hypothetical protein
MFQLEETIAATCTSANPRREFHGKERVRAIDLTFEVTGENTVLLDLIEPGLCDHHFYNKALEAGQAQLPPEAIGAAPKPNLRFPKLPLEYRHTGTDKARGYRWIWDWGVEEDHVDFTDVVMSPITYEISEGGTVKQRFTISYNGDELSDNELFGELSALATAGEVYMRLLAPPELVKVKKGYRAGHPDAARTEPDPAQGALPGTEREEPSQDGHVGDPSAFMADENDDVLLPAGSPEAALAATEPSATN